MSLLPRWWSRGPKPGPEAVRILMVCTGNICRSPTAEGVLRGMARARRLEQRVWVDSAGTHGFHVSEAPDRRAQARARERGYELSALRARHVVADDFRRFHLLLAMDDDNLQWLRRHAPTAAPARIALLMGHARRHTAHREVPDPYYGPPEGFDRVLDLVEDACEGLLEDLVDGRLDLPDLDTPTGTAQA